MNCDQIAPNRLAEVLSIWAAFASTAGIFITHVLTRSWDRRKQHADFIKQETRELLTALSALQAAYGGYAVIHSAYYMGATDTALKATDEKYTAALLEFYRMLRDRLYIADTVRELRVKERWESARDTFRKHVADIAEFEKAIDDIRSDLVKAAIS